MCLQMWRSCRPGLQKCPNPTKSQPKWANGAPGMPDWSIIFQKWSQKNTLQLLAATVASPAGKRANLVQPGPKPVDSRLVPTNFASQARGSLQPLKTKLPHTQSFFNQILGLSHENWHYLGPCGTNSTWLFWAVEIIASGK